MLNTIKQTNVFILTVPTKPVKRTRHTSKLLIFFFTVKEYPTNHGFFFRVLPWQTLSPDLSPIEHLWVELGRRVHHRQIHRKQYRSCVTHLCTSGDNIPQAYIQRLIGSMRRRCEAVATAKGCHTRYCLMCYAHMNLNYTIFVDNFFSIFVYK